MRMFLLPSIHMSRFPHCLSSALYVSRAPKSLPLFFDPPDGKGMLEPDVQLPTMRVSAEVTEDYVALRLTLRALPMELLRPTIPGLTPPH